jgi:hypothetical protein
MTVAASKCKQCGKKCNSIFSLCQSCYFIMRESTKKGFYDDTSEWVKDDGFGYVRWHGDLSIVNGLNK